MKYLTLSILSFVCIVLFSACVPEQRIIWSPNGQQAVVFGEGKADHRAWGRATEEDGRTLYLCDANGALSPHRRHHVCRVAWRPDSSGLVLACVVVVTNWAEAEPFLDPEEQSELIGIADAVYKDHVQSSDPRAPIETALKRIKLNDNKRDIVGLYLKHHHADIVIREKTEKEEPLNALVYTIETATVEDNNIQMDRVIARTTLPVHALRISPQNLTVAYVAENRDELLSLYIASLSNAFSPRLIDQRVSMYPDWSADGQYLVYAAANNMMDLEDTQFGAIVRSKVADDAGELLQEISKKEEVAIVACPYSRVRCLPDGGIVFSTFEVHLPATALDMPGYLNLFTLYPDRQATVSRLIPRSVEHHLGEWGSLFEFSPDYKQIAFRDSEERIAILTLATGDIQDASAVKHSTQGASDKIVGLPSWRSTGELCFIQSFKEQGQDPGATEVIIYLQGQKPERRIISADWPSALTESLGRAD